MPVRNVLVMAPHAVSKGASRGELRGLKGVQRTGCLAVHLTQQCSALEQQPLRGELGCLGRLLCTGRIHVADLMPCMTVVHCKSPRVVCPAFAPGLVCTAKADCCTPVQPCRKSGAVVCEVSAAAPQGLVCNALADGCPLGAPMGQS